MYMEIPYKCQNLSFDLGVSYQLVFALLLFPPLYSFSLLRMKTHLVNSPQMLLLMIFL